MLYAVIAVAALIILRFALKAVKAASAKRAAEAAEADRQRKLAEDRRKAEEERRQREAEAQRAASEREMATRAAIRKCPGSEKYRLDEQQFDVSADILTITGFTPASKTRFVAFDLETTGLDAYTDAIIEIGAVRVESGVITEEFSQLVDPARHIPLAASNVNHITDDMVTGMPKIYEVLPSFLTFIGDDILAAHNASFDAKFLMNACRENRFKAPAKFFDTMSLARYYPGAANKKLATLIDCAGIENDEAHRALGDARAVAQLIIHTNEIRSKKKVQA